MPLTLPLRRPVVVNVENYWEFPPIGNAGGLYHAKFQTINKQKIPVPISDPLDSHKSRRRWDRGPIRLSTKQRFDEVLGRELVEIVWALT